MTGGLSDIRPTLTSKEVVWVIGLVLGGIGYGALLTLGIVCLVAFFRSPKTRGRWFNREKVLAIHVVLVLLGNTFLQVWNAKSVIDAVFYTDPSRVTFFYHGWQNIIIALLVMLTEAVLVWRCYMVQEALSFTSRWHHVCWIFPALLWVVGAGLLAVVLLDPTALLADEAESHSPGLKLFLVATAVNLTLNTFGTSNIIARLLLHRRYVVAAFGPKNALAKYSLRTSNILLESAAINIPLAVLSIVGLSIQAEYAALLTQIITPGQCVASILVIYQVVRRRTVSEHMNNSNGSEPTGHLGLV